jgi:hypothetical protein
MTIKEGPHRTLHESYAPIAVEYVSGAFDKQLRLLDGMVARILKARDNKTDAELEVSLAGVELLKGQLVALKAHVAQQLIGMYPQMNYDVPIVSSVTRENSNGKLVTPGAPLFSTHDANSRTDD